MKFTKIYSGSSFNAEKNATFCSWMVANHYEGQEITLSLFPKEIRKKRAGVKKCAIIMTKMQAQELIKNLEELLNTK